MTRTRLADRCRMLALVTVFTMSTVSWTAAYGEDFVFTLDEDFALGILNGVNFDPPDSNQLQLNATGTTFPVMWIANAGEDTVSKIDTNTNCEIARYRTWLNVGTHGAFAGPAPSRTAVDGEGNVYVANRHFDGRPASVLKILAEGGIDRNGDGEINTSADSNGDCIITSDEIVPLVDLNGDGILEGAELADERVAWIRQIGPSSGLGRSLCIAPNGNIWLGLFSARQYYEIDPDNGSILSGPISTGTHSPYGCAVDRDGILWSASLSNNLGVLDTSAKTFLGALVHGGLNYGIAIGNGRVYLGNAAAPYLQYDPNAGAAEPDGNPLTGTFSNPSSGQGQASGSLGVGVEGNGDIVAGTTRLSRWDKDTGAQVWTVLNPANDSAARGVLPDANNDIWVVNLNRNTVTKFRGDTGAFLTTVPTGLSPYTYSDATGFGFRNITSPFGRWLVVIDGGEGAIWDRFSWNNEPEGDIPNGASIELEVRVANTADGLQFANFAAVSNGPGGLDLSGRFAEIRATLRANEAGESPILSDLVASSLSDTTLQCDIDGNGQVDRNDVNLIFAARGQTVPPGDPNMDLDGDGVITVNDGRFCVLQCTNPRCAP